MKKLKYLLRKIKIFQRHQDNFTNTEVLIKCRDRMLRFMRNVKIHEEGYLNQGTSTKKLLIKKINVHDEEAKKEGNIRANTYLSKKKNK